MLKRLIAGILLAALASPAWAANRTEWTAGNGAGTSWTAAFASSDLASMTHGQSVMSTDIIDNTSALDLYAVLSVQLAISSATPAAGDFIAISMAPLQQDGTTYGDGNMTAGTAVSWSGGPPFQPVCTISLNNPAGAQTALNGYCQPFLVPAGKWRFVFYLGTSAIALSAGTQTIKYQTYNLNLNN